MFFWVQLGADSFINYLQTIFGTNAGQGFKFCCMKVDNRFCYPFEKGR